MARIGQPRCARRAAARFPIRAGENPLQGVVTPCKCAMGGTFDVLYTTL
jgi:hypothetical protein